MGSKSRLGARSLLRHRDFMKLWAGESISVLGSQISALALPYIAIKTLHATPFEVGALGAVEFAPFILVSLHAGVIVDRVRRRPVLISTDLLRTLALLTVPIAFELDILTIGQLFVVLFITGVLTVFFDVAYQSYLPALIDRDLLPDGNGKLQMSESGAQIAGPGLAGALIEWFGAPLAVIFDAASFVVSAIAVMFIRKSEPAIERKRDADGKDAGPGMRAEIAEGVRYVFGNRYLRAIAACTSTSNLFSALMFAVFLLYQVRVLHFSAGLIGVVFMVGNIGFLIGAALCARITKTFGLGRTIVGSIVVAAVGAFFIAMAPRQGAVPWFIAGQLLMSVGIPVYNINQVSFRQAITPHAIQGRMNATMRFIVWGTMPIGSLLGGALGAAVGLHATLWIGAIGGALAILPVALTPVRSLTVMPTPIDDEGATEPPHFTEMGPGEPSPLVETPS
jgi:MFS family permease